MESNQVSGLRKAGIGLVTGLATLVTSASLGGCARNEAIISASYQDVQNAREIRKSVYDGGIRIDKDINGDGNYDVSIIGNGRVIIRVDRELSSGSETGSIGLQYEKDNQHFSVASMSYGYSGKLRELLFKKIYPIESRSRMAGFKEDGSAYDSYTGKDILDNKGKLKQRVINYNRPEVRDLERIEDFDNKGKMTKVVIRDKNSNKKVYVIQWNEKKKEYEVLENRLDMSFEKDSYKIYF